MQMQEPGQRSYTEGYEATSQAFNTEQPFIENRENMQGRDQQQKIYPSNTNKRAWAIVGIVLSSIGISIFVNGIVFSALGIKYNGDNPTLLTWSILGLVFSILLLLADISVMVISIVALALLKKRRQRQGRSLNVDVNIGRHTYPGFIRVNWSGGRSSGDD